MDSEPRTCRHDPDGATPDDRAIEVMLRRAGLRPTRQRALLVRILFGGGDRHVTAEILYNETARAGLTVSLATVYNTLHRFTSAGLLRQIATQSKTYFDTNTSEHHHFFSESEGTLVDIATTDIALGKLPVAPLHYEIVGIDVVIRVRRKTGRA